MSATPKSQPFIGPFHGRSELVDGRIMWAIYRGIDGRDGFSADKLVAYFERHQDAILFQNSAEPTTRLIAAAPELLSVLEFVKTIAKQGRPLIDSDLVAINQAIAKATGDES